MMYDYNDTMRFLGKQNSLIFCAGSPYAEQIKEVFEAHEKYKHINRSVLFDIGIDFFLLGFAMGKRAERERRKEGRKKKWLF